MHFFFAFVDQTCLCVFSIASRHFDWLDNLRKHIEVDDVIRKQILSERAAGEASWGGVIEECKRELVCVCRTMAEDACWRPGRPDRWFAPRPGQDKKRAMRTGRGGKHLFSSSEEESGGEDAPGGSRRVSDAWLGPTNPNVEFKWGGYIDIRLAGQRLSQPAIEFIEHQVNDFHSERMNSPPKASSLEYWALASLRFPLVAQIARRYLCVPASSATSERSFSKAGHIVRARRARLSDEHVKELTFLSWNQDLLY